MHETATPFFCGMICTLPAALFRSSVQWKLLCIYARTMSILGQNATGVLVCLTAVATALEARTEPVQRVVHAEPAILACTVAEAAFATEPRAAKTLW